MHRKLHGREEVVVLEESNEQGARDVDPEQDSFYDRQPWTDGRYAVDLHAANNGGQAEPEGREEETLLRTTERTRERASEHDEAGGDACAEKNEED